MAVPEREPRERLAMQVLKYTHGLSEGPPRGVPGEVLLRFAGTLSREEADAFKAAVDEACASVDTDDW
jgi:hypothetical protein